MRKITIISIILSLLLTACTAIPAAVEGNDNLVMIFALDE
jgi:starvation-inducible outer membrane lipoprotein